MYTTRSHITLICCFFIQCSLFAQLSPGKLTTSHQNLEGLSNCTQCHDIGNKVPDNKCLQCHDLIDKLIKNNRGYHASDEVQSKSCIECHSEHHGRKFEMTRFDEQGFDHDLAGYALQGQHLVIDCRDCHNPQNISDSKLKSRKTTYLGLNQDCLSCHDDFHQGSLSSSCIECHNFKAFRPALKFDHDKADFKIRGAHNDVNCIECHTKELRNGLEYQNFTNLKFSDCVDCHENPHQSTWNSKCSSCHTESSFNQFIGKERFNHNKTDFTLKGKHNGIDCFKCHERNDARIIFTDRKGTQENQCIACHDDPHDNKFGLDCAKCHNEESFFSLNDPSSFDHGLTDFNLEGLHVKVDCKACHKTRLTDPLDFNYCFDCHTDYHRGEFELGANKQDCNSCHSVYNPFPSTTFGLEEHQESSFPLDGAHLATPCFDCHISEDHWTFRNIGSQCIDCHDDVHQGFIPAKYYPEGNCTNCHNTEIWSDVQFNHALTEWTLDGKHTEVECRKCHIQDSNKTGIISQKFSTLKKNCISCHDNPHGNQFENLGTANCQECHTPDSWFPENFNHQQTAFPLIGKHTEVECNACHSESIEIDGILIRNYKIESFDCIDCHL